MSPICGRKPFQKQRTRYPSACQQTSCCHCPPTCFRVHRLPASCLPCPLVAVGYWWRRRPRCPIRTQATSPGQTQPPFCTAASPVIRRGLQQRCHCRPGAWWQVRWRVGVRLTYHACCPRHCAATLALVYAAGDGVSQGARQGDKCHATDKWSRVAGKTAAAGRATHNDESNPGGRERDQIRVAAWLGGCVGPEGTEARNIPRARAGTYLFLSFRQPSPHLTQLQPNTQPSTDNLYPLPLSLSKVDAVDRTYI